MSNVTIATEVSRFLNQYSLSAAVLARESGVSPVILSRMKKGKQKDVLAATADALRDAMKRLAEKHRPPEEEG